MLEGFGVLPGDTISAPHPPAGLDISSYGGNIYSASNFEPKIIVGEAPWAFLYQPDWIVATRANVSGIALFNDLTLRYAYLGKTE